MSTDSFTIMWAVRDPKKNILPWTMHPHRLESIQHFLHLCQPQTYPPTNGGATYLLGKNAKQVWANLENEGFVVERVRISSLLYDVSDADVIYDVNHDVDSTGCS